MKTLAVILVCLTFWLVGFQMAKDHATAGGPQSDATGRVSGISDLDSSSPRKREPRPPSSNRTAASDTGSARWLRWASSLTRTDVSDLPDLLEQVPAFGQEYIFLLEYWLQVDPLGLFHYWKERYVLAENDATWDLGHFLFYRWFQLDPASAATAVEQLAADGSNRYLENSDTLSNLADHDPRKAIRLASTFHLAVGDFIGYQWPEVIGNQPESWADFLAAHPAGCLTQNGLEAVGKSWGNTDPESAMDFSAKLQGQNLEGFRKEVFRSWGNCDFEEAHDWFFKHENARTRDLLRPTFLENWAKHDLDEALDWTRENMHGQRLEKALGGLASGTALTGLDASNRLWQNLTSLNEKTLALHVIKEALSIDPTRPPVQRPIPEKEAAWLSARRAEIQKEIASSNSND